MLRSGSPNHKAPTAQQDTQQFWQSKAEELASQVEHLSKKLKELQEQHDEEINVLNRTIKELRKELLQQASSGAAVTTTQSAEAPLHHNPKKNSPQSSEVKLPPVREKPVHLSDSSRFPAVVVEQTTRQDTTTGSGAADIDLGPNPNQLGSVVLSAFSPPCEASEGSSAQVEEYEWRRERNTERWYETSVLQAALNKYAECIRPKVKAIKKQRVEGVSSSTTSTPVTTSEPIMEKRAKKREPKKRGGIFSKLGWGGDDSSDSNDDESGGGKKKGSTSSGRNRSSTTSSGGSPIRLRDISDIEEPSLEMYVRLVGNQPEVSLVDPPQVPHFSTENLSPCLQKEFVERIGSLQGSKSSTKIGSSGSGDVTATNDSVASTGSGGDPLSAPPSGGSKGKRLFREDFNQEQPQDQRGMASDTTPSGGSANQRTQGKVRLRRQDEVKIAFHFPSMFADCIDSFGMSMSVLGLAAMESPWRLTESPGKSEAKIYYFSHFVVKTLTDSEVNFAENHFFPEYRQFVRSNRGDTMLPHFVGMFTVTKLKAAEKFTFMISNNVLQTSCWVSSIYDLKGSTVGREGTTTVKDGAAGGGNSSAGGGTASGTGGGGGGVDTSQSVVTFRSATGAPLLKDNDLPENRALLRLGSESKAKVLARLRADTAWLERLEVIDYSLLVGIRSRKGTFSSSPTATSSNGTFNNNTSNLSPTSIMMQEEEEEPLSPTSATLRDTGITSIQIPAGASFSSTDLFSEETYYLGLIDVFQQYSGKKKLENFAKGLLVNRHKISVVPPDEFAQRLCVLADKISN